MVLEPSEVVEAEDLDREPEVRPRRPAPPGDRIEVSKTRGAPTPSHGTGGSAEVLDVRDAAPRITAVGTATLRARYVRPALVPRSFLFTCRKHR
jgi:hypothetical protein